MGSACVPFQYKRICAMRARLMRCSQRFSDHSTRSTSSVSGNHIPRPVPLLLATWQSGNEDAEEFYEDSAAGGALGMLKRGELSELLGVSRGSNSSPSLRP